ncbi:MAG TPA: hypothetical protein VHB77_00870 [Planctomycetaceae bacterium]|nr:hypothetical protein [Planctomycetaceae bacterium]
MPSCRIWSVLRLPCPMALALLTLAGWLLAGTSAHAQEFRIYTRVYNEAGEKKNEAVARSLTLFHAGKTYDYLDNVGEVVIFEPAARQFTIINSSHMMASVITFDELETLVVDAEQHVRKYLSKLKQSEEPALAQNLATIEFMLDPKFQESYDAKQQVLRLNHPQFSYTVKCERRDSPEVVASYARYTEAMARLNYVLHPSALQPQPRLALCRALREKQSMPVEVDMRVKLNNSLHLRAEHKIGWQLDQTDRQLIQKWQTLLDDPGTKRVPFPQLQQVLLVDQGKRKS